MLKIHGDWSDRVHRILTYEEYQRYYGSLGGSEADSDLLLPRLIRMFTNRSLLFLGCSLGQDRILDDLRSTADCLPPVVHYAIVERPTAESDYRTRTHHLYEHNIRPIWYPQVQHELIAPLLGYLAEQMCARQEQLQPASPPAVRSSEVKQKRLIITHARVAEGDWLARVSVSYYAEADTKPSKAETEFSFYLSDGHSRDLTWYLEKYPINPLADFGPRCENVQNLIQWIGAELFDAVFGSLSAEAIYGQIQQDLRSIHTIVQANTPEGIALPWELMRDPALGRLGELALAASSFVRGEPGLPHQYTQITLPSTFCLLCVIPAMPKMRRSRMPLYTSSPLLVTCLNCSVRSIAVSTWTYCDRLASSNWLM